MASAASAAPSCSGPGEVSASGKGLPSARWSGLLPPPPPDLPPAPGVGPLLPPRTRPAPSSAVGPRLPPGRLAPVDPLFSPSSDSCCFAIAKPGPYPEGRTLRILLLRRGGSTASRVLVLKAAEPSSITAVALQSYSVFAQLFLLMSLFSQLLQVDCR